MDFYSSNNKSFHKSMQSAVTKSAFAMKNNSCALLLQIILALDLKSLSSTMCVGRSGIPSYDSLNNRLDNEVIYVALGPQSSFNGTKMSYLAYLSYLFPLFFLN